MNYPEMEEKNKKAIENLAGSFATIRAGRANAAVLDRIFVDYYGASTPIVQIASVSTPEPRTLVIQPWDASALKMIEKAIQASDLGINPTNDGKVIRLIFPQLTEERRKELVKQTGKYAEECKILIRNHRRDELDRHKQMKKKSEITEDDMRIVERELQEIVDKQCKEIDDLLAKKEKELYEV